MDIISHSIPNTWKNKMIEQGFNLTNSIVKEMTYFFETMVKNLEQKEEKMFYSLQEKNLQENKKK